MSKREELESIMRWGMDHGHAPFQILDRQLDCLKELSEGMVEGGKANSLENHCFEPYDHICKAVIWGALQAVKDGK